MKKTKSYIPRAPWRQPWIDPDNGDIVTAGGLFIYKSSDNSGTFWAVEEENSSKSYYSDPGGKYSHLDGNIYATIRREIYEETYGLIDVKVSDIKKFAADHGIIKLSTPSKWSSTGNVMYFCVLVPIDVLCRVANIEESTIQQSFITLRNETLKQNTNAKYKQIQFVKLNYDIVKAEPFIKINIDGKEITDSNKLGYRLINIIKKLSKIENSIVDKMNPIIQLNNWVQKDKTKSRKIKYNFLDDKGECYIVLQICDEHSNLEFSSSCTGKPTNEMKKFLKAKVAEIALQFLHKNDEDKTTDETTDERM